MSEGITKHYDAGDVATFYFIIKETYGHKEIKAWSDSKTLIEFYLKFHECSNFKVKKISKPINELINIIEESNFDGIRIVNMVIRGKNDQKKLISAPLTGTEYTYLRDQIDSFVATRIDYSYMNSAIPYLKNKFQKSLSHIYLNKVIDFVINNKSCEFITNIDLDELGVFIRSSENDFGK